MLKIVKASDPMIVSRLNMCIYASPGLGKTSLAFTADTPLLLDADRGSHRAINRKDTVAVNSWSDIANISVEDMTPYKTIVADTVGRVLDFLTADIIAENPKMGRGGALTLQGYGVLKSRFAAWLKMLQTFGKDVVLIAHMDEQGSGDDIKERLDVQGGSKGEIYKSVDAMGRIFIRDKARVIDFSPRENSFGKNPCNLEIIPFPDPSTNPDLLAKLMVTMKERMNHLSEDQKAAQSELEEWAIALNDFSTADEINQSLPEIKKASKAVQALAAKRAKDLGLTFNKTAKAYEGANA